MSISLNPVVGFKSTLQTKYHHVSRPNSMIQINGRRRGSFVLAVDNDRLVTDAIIKGHGGSESSIFDNQLPAMNSSLRILQLLGLSDRRTESKTSKSEMGRKVLDALRESDKGKKNSGLPEALKTCLMTASEGCQRRDGPFNFQGFRTLFIVVSFVLISTIMFATTYIVWKVGAIHLMSIKLEFGGICLFRRATLQIHP
ncbi:Differentiation-associated protein [Salix suchowensis]|nr:Differentiation-associated protein [Salix suchowensis]